MTTSTAPFTTSTSASSVGASFLPVVGIILEALWLIAAFLVPLIFLGQDYAISEARIAYVEVPKVALLRTLAGSMVLLLLIEWAITSHAFQAAPESNTVRNFAEKLRPFNLIPAISRWLKGHPVRWVILAAGFFFGITFLSTALSASVNNSVWGEIPGQDGYSAYTIASYAVLFGTIATHLKSRTQLWRLMGTVVLMGFLVGLYGIFQHSGNDFLGTTESSGGGATRVTIFMGNAIFAGALLSMTVPFTLMVAALNFQDVKWGDWGPLSKIGQLGRDWTATTIWAVILGVQLLGLMFTLSRGPWGGSFLAIIAFLGLIALSLGWRILLRSGLVVGLAGVLAVALLHQQDNISIINIGSWFGFLIAFLGLVGVFLALFVMSKFGRALTLIAISGIAVTVLAAVLIAPSALAGRGVDDATTDQSPSAGQISERVSSIKTDVLGGFIGGRGTHWKVSWELISERPWFEFDDFKLPWLRPLIGYGPDLFRYTYLLKSPADDFRYLPLEPDHAHNFFIHQTVEQGVLGGAAAVAIFLSVFGVAAHQLLRRRKFNNPAYPLIMFGLMAIILGRFLEMIVGLAKISDLTILWVIFGLFIASSILDKNNEPEDQADSAPPPPATNRRDRRRQARPPTVTKFNSGLLIRLAIVAVIAGGLGVVTFQKSINSVRAATAEGRALKYFSVGDFESTLVELNKAISLAPGVPNYHNNRAQIYLAYQLNPETATESGCAQQTENPYLVCLGLESLQSNSNAVLNQPFNYRSRHALANSAFNLSLNELALESYKTASSMVPNSWAIRNDLAESYIDLGQYENALTQIDGSLGITGESSESVPAFYIKGRALQGLGRLDEAITILKHSLSMLSSQQNNLDLIRVILTDQGLISDIDYLDEVIENDPGDKVSYYFRGLAHLRTGNTDQALADLETSIDLGFQLSEVQAARGYARFQLGILTGDTRDALVDLVAALEFAPRDARYNALYAEFQMYQGNYPDALDFLERASVLNPDLGLSHLLRARIYLGLGLEDVAKESLVTFSELPLPTGSHYANRGDILAFLDQPELAKINFDLAISINPNQASFYNRRGKSLASEMKFDDAIADFNSAIAIDPNIAEFFLNRGLVYRLLKNNNLSSVDFESAISLNPLISPPAEDWNPSSFADYKEPTVSLASPELVSQLRSETIEFRKIDRLLRVEADDPSYKHVLQMLGETYLGLELWNPAAETLTVLIGRFSDNPETYRNRGLAFLALGKIEDAMEDFSTAVSLDNTDEVNFVARGRGYSMLGKGGLALDDFNTAINLNPESSDAYKFRGSHLIRVEEYSASLIDLNLAIEISPEDDDAFHKRANAYIGLNQTSKALADLEKSIEIDITDPDYYFSRGMLRHESSQYPEALKDFSSSINLTARYADSDPRFVTPYLARSRTYLKLGNPNDAISDAEIAIRLLNAYGTLPEWSNLYPSINVQISDAYRLLGDAYTLLGRLEEAKTSYEQAAEAP